MHLNLKIQYPQLFYVFIWILFLSFSNSFSAFSQEDIKKDIQHKIKKLKETPNFQRDTTYINLLHDLNWEYIHYNLDSLLFTSKEIA